MKYSKKVYIYKYFSEKNFGKIYYFTENLNTNLLYTIYKTTLLFFAGIFILKRIIIIRNYRRIIILNIYLEKLENKRRKIILKEFFDYHRV